MLLEGFNILVFIIRELAGWCRTLVLLRHGSRVPTSIDPALMSHLECFSASCPVFTEQKSDADGNNTYFWYSPTCKLGLNLIRRLCLYGVLFLLKMCTVPHFFPPHLFIYFKINVKKSVISLFFVTPAVSVCLGFCFVF